MEIEAMYCLFRALKVVVDFTSGLELEGQPSGRLKEFIETELHIKLTEEDILPNFMGPSEEG
jgi:hypothetical protein